MTETTDEATTAEEIGTDELVERGRKISEMVDDEEARVLAEEAAEAEEHSAGFPCPVCGNNIELPNVPEQDPDTERCDVCKGWGMTATGSFLPDFAVAPCSKCQGRGWNQKQIQWVPPAELGGEQGEGSRVVAAENPELPALVLPDLTSLKVG